MRITERQLRAIVRESIVRTLQENSLSEGKLGRAFGTMALGGALMMGNPQDANAQLSDLRGSFRKTEETRTGYKGLPNAQLSRNLWIRNTQYENALKNGPGDYADEKYWLLDMNENTRCFITLGDNASSSIETLLSLKSLIAKQSGTVYGELPNGETCRFKYVSPNKLTITELRYPGTIPKEDENSLTISLQEIEKAITFIKQFRNWCETQ